MNKFEPVLGDVREITNAIVWNHFVKKASPHFVITPRGTVMHNEFFHHNNPLKEIIMGKVYSLTNKRRE